MDMERLEFFVSAAYCQNLTKAAELCHVTQATMSRHISALEAEIGTPLFIRSKSGVKLTPAGVILFRAADSLQEQYRDIIQACRASAGLTFPKLRIATGPYEHLLVTDVLNRFSTRFPSYEFNDYTYTYKILATRCANHSVDFVFCTKDDADACGCTCMHIIYDEPWKIVAGHDNPFWLMEYGKNESLNNQRIVVMYRNEFEPVEKYCIKHHIDADFCETNFLSSMLLMLRTTDSIAIVPPFINGQSMEDLRMEPMPDNDLAVEFVAAYDPKNDNPGCKFLMNVCREAFPTNA